MSRVRVGAWADVVAVSLRPPGDCAQRRQVHHAPRLNHTPNLKRTHTMHQRMGLKRTLNVNADTYNAFRTAVLNKHGKLRGTIESEATQALMKHTLELQITKPKTHP